MAVLGRFDGAATRGVALGAARGAGAGLLLAAMVELVVPLAITVLVVQNGQGIAVLQAAGHKPPVNAIAVGVRRWARCSAPWSGASAPA